MKGITNGLFVCWTWRRYSTEYYHSTYIQGSIRTTFMKRLRHRSLVLSLSLFLSRNVFDAPCPIQQASLLALSNSAVLISTSTSTRLFQADSVTSFAPVQHIQDSAVPTCNPTLIHAAAFAVPSHRRRETQNTTSPPVPELEPLHASDGIQHMRYARSSLEFKRRQEERPLHIASPTKVARHLVIYTQESPDRSTGWKKYHAISPRKCAGSNVGTI